MQPSHSLLMIFELLSLASVGAGYGCFSPNGTQSPDNGRKCVSLDNTASMCCGQTDLCLPNGLCEVQVDQSESIYYRDTCSTPSWPESGCLKVCDSESIVDIHGNSQITPCGGSKNAEKWCCGNSTSCCGTGDEVIVPTINIYAATSTSTSTIASTSTANTTTQSTSYSTSTTASTSNSTLTSTPKSSSEPDSPGLSIGAKAGVGVGVSAGAIALIGLLAFFLRRRGKNKDNIPSGNTSSSVLMVSQNPRELEAPNSFHEKPATDSDMHELPDNSGSQYMTYGG
ncbi:hypothetical protein N7533_008418 [Penicillium manginii]|uniref:uncharacterized protein n=1 Tax=Penicillium manginii TaxID=203109 RepID=UPI002547EE43|nr:uncharacterized protein N7533_008418 [Penicillium manginii]KAJ5743548.1 hypothetical protein N7533_008418 [Penicillium manginii]